MFKYLIVEVLDRWLINDLKEERLIGLSKIHHITPSHKGIPSSYIKGFKEYECEREGATNIYPKVEIVKGNPYYEEAKNYSAVSRTYRRLMDFVEMEEIEGKEEGVYVCKLVLTFPKELSEYYYGRDETGRAWEIFKGFWVRMQEEFCKVDKDRELREKMGAEVNLHIWRTRAPLEPHYHFHVSFLNVVEGEEGRREEGRRFSPKLDGAILEWLKEKWRRLLEEEGRRVFGGEYELERINAYYSFVSIENKEKVLHGLKYQNREWVVDFCDWSEKEGYEGEIPRKMERYKNRARVYGYWKNLGRDEEAESELKELERGRKKVCPFCGTMTEKKGEVSTEEVLRKLKNSEMGWYEFSKGELTKREPPPEWIEYLRRLCEIEED